MGEALVQSRHYVYLFIMALLFLFAILTRKSIWIYWVSPSVRRSTRQEEVGG